jgi:hypothetical protein
MKEPRRRTILFARPFVGVTTSPTGFVRVGRCLGYRCGLELYSFKTRIGMENAADLPSPVAVQQKTSSPSRIGATSSSWTGRSPSFHCGTTFRTIDWRVLRPMGSCQRDLMFIIIWQRHRVSKKSRGTRQKWERKEEEGPTRDASWSRANSKSAVYIITLQPNRAPAVTTRLTRDGHRGQMPARQTRFPSSWADSCGAQFTTCDYSRSYLKLQFCAKHTPCILFRG